MNIIDRIPQIDAIANKHRCAIIRFMLKRNNRPALYEDIMKYMDENVDAIIDKSSINRHIKALEDAGILIVGKNLQRRRVFSVQPELAEGLAMVIIGIDRIMKYNSTLDSKIA